MHHTSFDERPRLPRTGTSADSKRLPVDCKCGQTNLVLAAELEVTSTVECRYCGIVIGVGSAEWRDKINEALDVGKKLTRVTG